MVDFCKNTSQFQICMLRVFFPKYVIDIKCHCSNNMVTFQSLLKVLQLNFKYSIQPHLQFILSKTRTLFIGNIESKFKVNPNQQVTNFVNPNRPYCLRH